MSAGIPEIPQGLENQGPDDHEEYVPPATVTEDTSGTVEGFETSNTVGSTSDTTDTGTTGYNPAWSPLLEKIPTPFHEEIRPFLTDWDKNFNKVQSQYAPYKTFVDNQVAPESIENSLKLAQLINANPRLVYDQLGERFGFASGQGQNEVEENNEEEEFSEGDFQNPLENPALKPFIEQQQRLASWVEQQEASKQEFAIQQQIQNEWSQIESTHGSPIPPNVKTEMIKRSIFIADAEGREPNLMDGYNDYNRFVAQVRGQRANNTAPQVFSGNGGVPSTPTGITGDMTDEQRIAYIAERAKLLNQNSTD